jgi:3-hydroxybutyryl-CoA dehydrogenase
VIEAAPEDLEVKRALFGALAEAVAPDAVLATNTSSLLVSEIAAGVPEPERVVGLHFFNPVAKMQLVELVAGAASSAAALARARAVGEALGKQVILAADGPGFLVNRCNRPFSLEALRIVQERLATPEQVDRICRLGCGFRMGPFELMDLVGIDVGHAIARSFFAQSAEPRWRPSPLAARMAASGRHGRKSGQGWYSYPPGRPADPPAAATAAGDGLVVIAGESELAAWLLSGALEAGWDATTPLDAEGEVPALIVDCGATEEDPPLQGGPQLLLCDAAPLSAQDPGGGAAGFFMAPPFGAGGVVELTRTPTTAAAAARGAEAFFSSLGRRVEWVGDAPGLVSGRIVAQLVNEACFALGEGVGSAADIDLGMRLGLNHPRGPLAWGDAIGAEAVLSTVLGLWEEYREERYRPAPALVRAARAEIELGAP